MDGSRGCCSANVSIPQCTRLTNLTHKFASSLSRSSAISDELFLKTNLFVCREALYEDESFPERELAALVAAKVYYHLQEYNESMVFALGAGKLFQLDQGGEFEETIIGK